jgi:dCTP deaminase
MSTVTKAGITERLLRDVDPLVITPLLSPRQIGGISVDVRLGNQFIVFRSHRFGIFESFGARHSEPRKIQERQIMRFGERFALHPGTLILGCTFEYISVPNDLECQVEGRSSLARLGLQVVTASAVEPGFKGVVTLELSNVGSVPLTLMPGIRVAQLVFHETEPGAAQSYSPDRKYHCPIGPEFSRLEDDYDWQVFSADALK